MTDVPTVAVLGETDTLAAERSGPGFIAVRGRFGGRGGGGREGDDAAAATGNTQHGSHGGEAAMPWGPPQTLKPPPSVLPPPQHCVSAAHHLRYKCAMRQSASLPDESPRIWWHCSRTSCDTSPPPTPCYSSPPPPRLCLHTPNPSRLQRHCHCIAATDRTVMEVPLWRANPPSRHSS